MISEPLLKCLTMSAYSAMNTIHFTVKKHPEMDIEQCIAFIKRTKPSAYGFDYKRGRKLFESLELGAEWEDTPSGIRFIASEIISKEKPWWLRLVPQGRNIVANTLDIDHLRILTNAGLFDPEPCSEILAWWDKVAMEVRGLLDLAKVERGRDAERLSLDHEKKRLKSLGVDRIPEWVSLNDNTLGYDIRSFDLKNGLIVSKLIEVKSAASDIIIITRNEWDNAKTAGANYCFHVWTSPEKKLNEYSVSEMSDHIPIDRASGEWSKVKVTL